MKKIAASIAGLILSGIMTYATTNEITAYVSINLSKDSLQLTKSSGNQIVQMEGMRYYSQVYNLSTTNTSMSKGAVGNLGWCYMRSLVSTTTNIAVNISFDCGVTTNMQLLPSEAQMFRLAPAYEVTNISAKVSAGTGDFEFTVIEK